MLTPLKTLVGETGLNLTTWGDGRIESLLKDLANVVKPLRSACPPPIQECRATFEKLQANAADTFNVTLWNGYCS